MTSTEEIAPERIAAAVSNADHCQIGPLGRRTLADLRTALLGTAFTPALMGPEVFIVDFFLGAVLLETLCLLITVFLVTSRPHTLCRETVRAAGFGVEVDDYWRLRVRLFFGSIEVDVRSGSKTEVKAHRGDVGYSPTDGVIGRPSLWIAEDFWVLRFRLMVKRGPSLWRPQASEGEAQHGPFCWTGRFSQGDECLHCE